MSMMNLDTLEQKKKDIISAMTEAAVAGDAEKFGVAFSEWTEYVQAEILEKAELAAELSDTSVLAARGVRQLTGEERKYYQKVIDAMKSPVPQQSLSSVETVLPKTTIDAVFDDLREAHPLLSAIRFQNTGALVEIILSTSDGAAAWGDLTATINSELSGAFSVLNLTLKKLSAFFPVAKAYLDLGPEWLDQYVREVLAEALAAQLEAAIVDGDGNGKPLGMTRALTGDSGGAFPRKTPIAVTALDPATIGTILNTVSQNPNGKSRVVPALLMVVNPADYYTKVYPANTVRTADGGFNRDVFPYPIQVEISAAVPSGFAVFGLASRYFFGLGTSRGGKIEYSDEYKFLEDQRTYLVKLYGNGRPLDANAFVYADISGLTPYIPQVIVANAAEFSASTTPEG